MAMATRSAGAALLVFTLLTLATMPARANLFSLAASGTISENSSGDSTIPIGTPWSFKLVYDTAARDLDFEVTGSPDPTFGRFTNTATPPALIFFHYQAGGYEVTVDDPADFGTGSGIDITFTSVNAIDINIDAPAFFPSLAGGPVSFHADFNAFSTAPIFWSDELPTNTALGPGSFDQSTVSLLPTAGVVSGSSLTSLTLTAVSPGDVNFDGVVDIFDINLVSAHWSESGPVGDANGDGTVDIFDVNLISANWTPSGASTVPEPSTILTTVLALAVLGLMALGRRTVGQVSRRRARGAPAQAERCGYPLWTR
jgi:Dockerin type I domain/PEP-CTERM motif